MAVYTLNFTIEPTGEVKPSRDTDPWTEENGILIFFDFRYRLSKQHALLVAIEIVETENMKWFRPSDEPDGDWLLDFDAFKSAFGEPFTSWDWLPSEANLSPSYSERSPSFTALAFSITEPPQTVS